MSENDAICLRIWGGLGNQMFQYATGYALAKRLGVNLLIDPISGELEHTKFGLDLFGIEPEYWQPAATSSGARFKQLFGRGKSAAKKRIRQWPGERFIQEHLCHADGFADLGPGTYLSGYFQSDQFFADAAEDLRQLFALENVVPSISPELVNIAQSPQSVSVHIRRGDYANDPKVLATHGVLDESYYGPATELMERLIKDAHWLVFSDDPETADQLTAHVRNRTLVTGHSREQDLCLMSRCSNHVIGNSSFSWWGAWLGHNPSKTVIAPRRWFAKQELRKVYVNELYPQNWILV